MAIAEPGAARLGWPVGLVTNGGGKMFRLRSFILIVALISNCQVVYAQDVNSADYIMPGCRNFIGNTDVSYLLQGLCAGSVGAIIQFGRRLDTCIPSAVNVSQSVLVVVQYIDARPARMHEAFEVLALEALQQAWPCKA